MTVSIRDFGGRSRAARSSDAPLPWYYLLIGKIIGSRVGTGFSRDCRAGPSQTNPSGAAAPVLEAVRVRAGGGRSGGHCPRGSIRSLRDCAESLWPVREWV